MANEIILTVTPKISVDELQKELEIALDKIANPTVKPTLSSKEFTDQLNTLSKSSETVFSSLDTLIGAAGQTMSSLTGNTVDFSGAIQTANGIVSAAQTAVTAVTSAVQLASAAQVIWNAAMSANPIAIVVIAVAALAAGVAALCAIQDSQISTEEQLAAVHNGLANTYTNVLSGLDEYKKGVEGATSKLDVLNTSTGLTTEKQQALADEMSTVQEQINTICSTASDERRQLTDEETTALEELIQKEQEIAQREIEINEKRASSVMTYATQIATSSQYTAAAFEAEAQTAAKTAQESYEQRTTAANEYMIQRLSQLEQEAQVNAETRANYSELKDGIIKDYEDEKAAAQTTLDETNAVLAYGYASRAETAQQWVDTSAGINAQELELKKKFNDDLQQTWADYNAVKDKDSAEALDKMIKANSDEELLRQEYANNILALEQQKQEGLAALSTEEITTLLGMVTQSEGAYDQLDSATKSMVDQFLLDIATLPAPVQESMKSTLAGMNLEITEGGKLVHANGKNAGQELISGWTDEHQAIIDSVKSTVKDMDTVTGNSNIDAPHMLEISNAEARAYSARTKIEDQFVSPIYQEVQVSTYYTHSGPGGPQRLYAKGGVTGYAKGGVNTANPKISKHAAGVFTKRTRLWDPITGINEYGEAGHEALLPLKESVFNEIARGITRQLSPAKLSGLMSQLKSAVQGEMSEISVQMTASSDYSQSSVKSDRMIDRLTGKMDAILDKLEGLASLSVLMDGQKVGKLVTATVNAGLNDIYSNSERSRF